MAPSELVHRVICPVGYYYSMDGCYPEEDWHWWGRWVLAAGVVLFFILAFLLFACIRARRQRRRGVTPMYGTGWMAPSNHYGPPPAYQQQPWHGGNYGPPGVKSEPYPPPEYGYYGASGAGQTEGVRVPDGTYHQGGQYAPPAGPPPGK